ncbi:MAG: hypothetical protein U1F47_08040 [Hyphomicrobiales bacterium]
MSAAGTTARATGLEAAIAAGVIDRATAERLKPFLAGDADTAPAADPDDERLRLITGFNDIFVTIGLVLFLGGLGYVLSGHPTTQSGLELPAAAWGLAEFFTRRRRMALPSILLLVVFVASVFYATANFAGSMQSWGPSQLLAGGLAAAAAALLHWLRFHVPITVAAGVAALAVIALALAQKLAPDLLRDHPIAVFLPLGLAIFALAMWFDASDRTRQTRRTDIAFWLHLLAAPIIVHPILLAVSASGDSSTGQSALVVGIFLVLGVVALIVDRRAILVSSLSYLAYAAGTLISASGLASSSYAPSALAVGAVVLLLSAAWRPLRRGFVRVLPPGIRQRVPVAA